MHRHLRESYHLGNRRTLLTNGVIDADEVVALAVDDGVEGNRSLAGLAIANNEFALSAADGDHGVYGLQSGGHGLAHGLAGNDAGSDALQGNEFIGRDRTLVVNRHAERIDDAADQGVAHGHAHDAAGALDFVAFLDLGEFAEQDHADLIFFEVHSDSGDAVREAEQLAGHDLVKAVDTGDSVTKGNDGANFVDRDLRFVVLDLLAD